MLSKNIKIKKHNKGKGWGKTTAKAQGTTLH